MLKHLSITNYAIIDRLQIELEKGFTVITGETGAGKSILLGALSLILGQRADKAVLNDETKKCIVEGEFEFDLNKFKSFFDKHELDYETPNIIRREINSKGKSRAFVNDTPVNLNILKELTSGLIDIHSQHETLNIQNNNFQLSVIDAFVNNEKALKTYKKGYLEYVELKDDLKRLVALSSQSKADVDYISFQVDEIEALQLKPNEKEKIEAELELLNNSEEIKSVLENAEQALSIKDQNLVIELKEVTNLFLKINNCSEVYNSIYERLNSLVIELEDLSDYITRENEGLSFNNESTSYLNSRLSSIFSIEQKHNISSTAEILQLLEELRAQLKETSSYDERIDSLSVVLKEKEESLFKEAKNISKKREACFEKISQKIKNDLVI
ncbi:MAG: AAA family ATPase [Vicingaceae bacterium]|nr:AAA family ATPase [Vicingaceae bacterium]